KWIERCWNNANSSNSVSSKFIFFVTPPNQELQVTTPDTPTTITSTDVSIMPVPCNACPSDLIDKLKLALNMKRAELSYGGLMLSDSASAAAAEWASTHLSQGDYKPNLREYGQVVYVQESRSDSSSVSVSTNSIADRLVKVDPVYTGDGHLGYFTTDQVKKMYLFGVGCAAFKTVYGVKLVVVGFFVRPDTPVPVPPPNCVVPIPVPTETCPAAFVQQLQLFLNDDRSKHGYGSLSVSSQLSTAAQAWASTHRSQGMLKLNVKEYGQLSFYKNEPKL